MKLVNVDDLKVLVAVESKGEIRYGKLVTDLFDDIPTIKAIPIDFIKSFSEKLIDRKERWLLETLVEVWEKENGEITD